MKWPLVRLGDCCNIVSGATPKTGIDNYWGGSILWATPKDVSNLDAPWLTDTPDKITEAGYASCSTQMLPAGAVLVTSRAPIGNIAIAAKPMCTNQGFKSLVPGPTVHSGYLYHCMMANSDRLQALGNGATFKEVSKRIVENFEIPLPPLEEQKRIAAILDKADSLRRKRQQAICLSEDFLRAIFLDTFGDPVTNPKSWPVVAFGDVVKNCDGQRVPVSSADRALRQGAYPYYGASGVIDSIDDFLFEGPSLLIGEDGANLLARSTPIAFIATGKYWVNNHAHVLQENGKACLEFLEFAINQMRLDDYITGSAQPKLNQANLNRIPIILPPIELQKKFVASRSAIGKLQEKYNRSLAGVDDMASALQNEAFA